MTIHISCCNLKLFGTLNFRALWKCCKKLKFRRAGALAPAWVQAYSASKVTTLQNYRNMAIIIIIIIILLNPSKNEGKKN